MALNSVKIVQPLNTDIVPVPFPSTDSRIKGYDKDVLNTSIAYSYPEIPEVLYNQKYLPGAPRNDPWNDPVNNQTVNKDELYKKKKDPYYIYQNGIEGIVQDKVNNANYVRGNTFGLPYPFEKEIKDLAEYTVESPYRDFGNAETVTYQSQFYPYPGFQLRFNKNYREHPHRLGFNLDGQPLIFENMDNMESTNNVMKNLDQISNNKKENDDKQEDNEYNESDEEKETYRNIQDLVDDIKNESIIKIQGTNLTIRIPRIITIIVLIIFLIYIMRNHLKK